MRASTIYSSMKQAMRMIHLRIRNWRPKSGSGFDLGWRLAKLNSGVMLTQFALASTSAVLCVQSFFLSPHYILKHEPTRLARFYVPAYFLRELVSYLEQDPEKNNRAWGWAFCVGLFLSNAIMYLLSGQLWSLSTTTFQVRLKIQLNSILFAKTLVRKDVASSSASASKDGAAAKTSNAPAASEEGSKKEENEFQSKAQIMTLMTTGRSYF
jgi:hypothetical protein